MIFSRKERKTADHSPNNETGLSPVLHVIESLNEYRTDLINKEVASLFELSRVGSSFDGVIEKADKFQTQLQEFGESFSNINQAADQYGQVRSAITQAVTEAQDKVEALKDTSLAVEKSYRDMEHTFGQLQSAVKNIQHCMSKIVSIADQTNILAINASIEAARAGQDGKSFTVVAARVRELAEEIKQLASEVDSGVQDVESGTTQLNGSISASEQALGHSIETVNSTYDSFYEITKAAEVSASVQTEISGVIEDSRQALQVIYRFFDEIKAQYQEVVKHIERASSLGTMKSAMFEDIDNMMSQIPPIIMEAEH